MIFDLAAHPPFSLAAVVNSHGWVQLAPFTRDGPNAGFRYVMQLRTGRVIDLVVRERDGGVTVEVDEGLDDAEQAEVVRAVSWMLGLDQDFASFYALAGREPKLAHVVERAQGRILRSATVFEDAVKTILTTNTTWAGTKRMVSALVDQFGASLPAAPSRRAFPVPERLAALDEMTLRQAAKLGFRSPSVLALASAVADGDQDLESLKALGLPTPELRERLLRIRGVGSYAAANLLMLIGRYDFVPIDSWALKMVSQEWHGGLPVGPAEVEAAFAHWGEWKGLAYFCWDWANPA